MTTAVAPVTAHISRAIDLDGCDRSPSLSPSEQAALAKICGRSRVALPTERAALWRLIEPVNHVLVAAGAPPPPPRSGLPPPGNAHTRMTCCGCVRTNRR